MNTPAPELPRVFWREKAELRLPDGSFNYALAFKKFFVGETDPIYFPQELVSVTKDGETIVLSSQSENAGR